MQATEILLEIAQHLKASENLMRGVAVALERLHDHLEVEGSLFLLIDQVTKQYMVELASHLSEAKKSKLGQKLHEVQFVENLQIVDTTLFQKHELAALNFPTELSVPGAEKFLLQPIHGKKNQLLGLLFACLPKNVDLEEVVRVYKIVGLLIALSFEAHGFEVPPLSSNPQEIPMVLDGVVAVSPQMQHISELIKKVAPSRATVLIQGESGTGKQLIANSLHQYSLRSDNPFIAVSCASLSEHLLESELFGHERGAFSHALRDRQGRFELADGGTLFLDEIGNTSLSFQSKLLRVLQENTFERIGGSDVRHVDIRFICSSNMDLQQSIAQNQFREDLYYRLNVVLLTIPPLRDRREDIPPLVHYFLNQLNQEYQKNIPIHSEDLEFLKTLPWHGNVRELENVIHSAFLRETDGMLNVRGALEAKGLIANAAAPVILPPEVAEQNLVDEEVHAIEDALKKHRGVQSRAAEHLGISLRQLRYRIKKYNIVVRKLGSGVL